MNITAEELTELLGQAFDKGWVGYKDLRESLVEAMVEEFEKSHSFFSSRHILTHSIDAFTGQPLTDEQYSRHVLRI